VLLLIEILSVCGTILYIYFAVKKKPAAWIFGTLASTLAVYLFFDTHLYGSGLLNIIYALQGIIGYINWRKYIADKQPSYQLRWYFHLLWALICILASLLLSWLFLTVFGGKIVYADILLATFSIFATSLEIRKDTSCWWYWITCNLAYAALYFWQSIETGESLYLYAILMLGLAVFSYAGLKAWERSTKIEVNV
jgi:nicotinamide mononucleotide transporter